MKRIIVSIIAFLAATAAFAETPKFAAGVSAAVENINLGTVYIGAFGDASWRLGGELRHGFELEAAYREADQSGFGVNSSDVGLTSASGADVAALAKSLGAAKYSLSGWELSPRYIVAWNSKPMEVLGYLGANLDFDSFSYNASFGKTQTVTQNGTVYQVGAGSSYSASKSYPIRYAIVGGVRFTYMVFFLEAGLGYEFGNNPSWVPALETKLGGGLSWHF